MKNRKINETDVLAAELSDMQNEAMSQMIDTSTLSVYQVQQQVQEVEEQQNPLAAPIKAASKYVTEATITKMPVWIPPTLDNVLQFVTLEHMTEVLSASYIMHQDMGTINEGRHSVKKLVAPKRDELIFDLVSQVFRAHGLTIQQLKMQEQMFKAVDLVETRYEHIPAYLLADVDSFLAIPPFDIRPRLLLLLTLSFCQVDLTEPICAFFLCARVCDFVESVFWLVHTVVFLGSYGRTRVSDLLSARGLEPRVYSGKYHVPEHLDLVQSDLSVSDYLVNRCADDYAALQRCWMGARSPEKDIIQEYFPYFTTNAVYRGFLRTFPQFSHVFGLKFQETLYNNVIYMCSGILNYPDFQQQIVESIFGESSVATAHAFVQYISGGSALMGQESSDELNLKRAMFGIYELPCSELSENMRKTSEFYKSDETNQNQLDEGAITYGAVVKPVDFDFVLFDDLIQKNEKYSVYRAATRNAQNSQSARAGTLIDQSLLFQSNQTIDDAVFTQMPSLSQEMRGEALRVVRHAIPRTTLESIQDAAPRVMSPMRGISKKAHKNERQARSHAQIFDLDEVEEPETKYTQLQTGDFTQTRKQRKKPTNFTEMVEQDIEDYLAQEAPAADNSTDLQISQLTDTQGLTHQKANSATVDDTFIIRLPERLRPHKPEETTISQVISNEVVTNNDLVLRMNDPEYQKIIDTAVKSVSTLYAQKEQYKPLGRARSPTPDADTYYADAIEIMKAHPLRVTNQALSVTTTSPLLIRYLSISGAPTPADFKNVIIEDECRRDPNLGRSDFYARKQAHLNGGDAHAISMGGTSIRQVNVVRRTRNDPWIAPSNLYSGKDETGTRLSPNRFHLDYQQKKGEIQKLRDQDKENQREELVDLEVSKALFLDPNLRGRQARTAALSKAIVQEVDGTTTRDGNVAKGNKSQIFLHEMREELKQKMKNVDLTERIAHENQQMEAKRKQKEQQESQTK